MVHACLLLGQQLFTLLSDFLGFQVVVATDELSVSYQVLEIKAKISTMYNHKEILEGHAFKQSHEYLMKNVLIGLGARKFQDFSKFCTQFVPKNFNFDEYFIGLTVLDQQTRSVRIKQDLEKEAIANFQPLLLWVDQMKFTEITAVFE